jgi:hypothetical protein
MRRRNGRVNRDVKPHATTAAAERTNNKNRFFRPVGLELRSRLCAPFQPRNRLNRLTFGLANLQSDNPGGVLDGIRSNQGRIEASGRAKNAAFGLCRHLLGVLSAEEGAQVLKSLREVTKNPNYSRPAPMQNLPN